MNAGVGATSLHRVLDLWFEDGSVVLQAENAQYCVYRGILARRSPIFADMFAVGVPNTADAVDGCPLVVLSDTETDMTHFLKALFDTEFFRPFPELTTFPVLSGCLRLAHKYEVADLRDRALIHLSSRFRTELAAHADMRYRPAARLRKKLQLEHIATWPALISEFLVDALHLARLADALWLVPSILYHISVQVAAGETIHLSLPAADQELIVKASPSLERATRGLVNDFSDRAEPEDCDSPDNCYLARNEFILDNNFAVTDLFKEKNPFNALEFLESAMEDLRENEEHCAACARDIKANMRAGMQELWDAFPEMFGLPGWSVLSEMKERALGLNSIV
ncbi:BTB domain-containing protein [Mycena kentingensis (nom. inval.)]|nr:BTB domain-containing protein [Mycena kentingensis (nom. inval.)]